MADRVVKTTLIIDDKGSVKVVKGVGDEAARTEGKLTHLDKGVKGLGKSFGGLKSMLAGGLGLVGAGGIAFGLKDVISKTKEVAEETEKFHSVTGIGVQQSMQYTQALKARGLSGEAVTKAFGFLAKNIRSAELQEGKFAKGQASAAAKGKLATVELGRQAKALQELTHMSAAQFQALGSEEKKLQTVTKAFEKLAPGMQKTRLERELFGRGGNQLSIVLENNNLNIDKQAQKVREYFGIIHGGQKGQEELLEKQSEAKMAWEGLEFQLGTKLTPVLIKVFAWFSKTVKEIEQGHGPWGRLAKDIEGVAKFAKELWQWFERLVGPTNALKAAVGGLMTVLVASKVAGFVGALKTLGPAASTQGGLIGGVFGKAFAAAAIIALGAIFVKELPKIMEAASKALGITPSGGQTKGEFKYNTLLGANQPGENLREGEGALHKRFGVQWAPNIPTLRGLRGGGAAGTTHDQLEASRLVTELGGSPSELKVDLHIDGHKFAEAIGKNHRATRRISEDVGHYGLKRAARE